MRNISFSLTTPQFLAKTKDVTRRLNWLHVKPGDRLMGVEKGMGLQKGEKIKRLRVIEVVTARREQLDQITQEDVVREGFPHMTPGEFVEMFCEHNGCYETTEITRIEFKHIDGPVCLNCKAPINEGDTSCRSCLASDVED